MQRAEDLQPVITKESTQKEIYSFKKIEKHWYMLSFDDSRENADAELLEGSDKILNVLSNGEESVRLRISKEYFEGASRLLLSRMCEAPEGGGLYIFNNGTAHRNTIPINDLLLLVFGDIPERIFVQKLVKKKVKCVYPTATIAC